MFNGPFEGAALVCGAQDGASLYLETFDGFLVEHNNLCRFAEYAVEALDAAYHFPVVFLCGAFDDAAYYRVEAGAVASAGQYHHSFKCH